ncbi:hypothetical protein [Chromobacterium amazonense]|uniref:hypothetical protein n=1 Tax=Chromobacterium amazonense TaxID=1382803 RepID=UPI0011B227A4|nr:hypothetical protein [Chromobacterium amazonense]
MKTYLIILLGMLAGCAAVSPPAPPELNGSIEPVNYNNPISKQNYSPQSHEFEAKPIVVKETGTELKQFRGLDPAKLEFKNFVE